MKRYIITVKKAYWEEIFPGWNKLKHKVQIELMDKELEKLNQMLVSCDEERKNFFITTEHLDLVEIPNKIDIKAMKVSDKLDAVLKQHVEAVNVVNEAIKTFLEYEQTRD